MFELAIVPRSIAENIICLLEVADMEYETHMNEDYGKEIVVLPNVIMFGKFSGKEEIKPITDVMYIKQIVGKTKEDMEFREAILPPSEVKYFSYEVHHKE